MRFYYIVKKLYTFGGGCRVVRKIHLRLCANRELVYHSPLIYKIPYKTPYSLKKNKNTVASQTTCSSHSSL